MTLIRPRFTGDKFRGNKDGFAEAIHLVEFRIVYCQLAVRRLEEVAQRHGGVRGKKTAAVHADRTLPYGTIRPNMVVVALHVSHVLEYRCYITASESGGRFQKSL